MLTHPLFEQLKTLRWQGVLEAFQEQIGTPDINRLSFDERFALLIERECLVRDNRKLTNRLRQAKLKEQACIEDIDYSCERQLSRTVITRLAQCNFIARKENLLITGPTGTGKPILLARLLIKPAAKDTVRDIFAFQSYFKPLLLLKATVVISN